MFRCQQSLEAAGLSTASFNFGVAEAKPDVAGVSVRFQLSDSCGAPIPFLDRSAFQCRAGPAHRLITEYFRQEGAVTIVEQENVVDSSAKYMVLLLDISMSMVFSELIRITRSFIDAYLGGSGNTFVKIMAFGGSTELITLTSPCTDGFCSDATSIQMVLDNMQNSLDEWAAYDPGARPSAAHPVAALPVMP